MPDLPFYSSDLNTETYDLAVGRLGPANDVDVAFCRDLAASSGPRVLELGCGTGRVTIALARAGLDATGLDLSPGMLREALSKVSHLDPATQARLRFVEGDMTDFSLVGRFDTVLIPARAFAFLLTPEAQRACLARVFEHLRPGGVLSIHLFDPRLDLCMPGLMGGRTDTALDPTTGHTIRVEVLSRQNDTVAQVLREPCRFTELDGAGRVLRVEEEQLVLRWTYRYEMRHLLELAGFDRIDEQSDFEGSPPAYGLEQVWVCRRPEA
jgi:SAM-dependent methyltransferase